MKYYYLLTALPAPDVPGHPPPLSEKALLDVIGDDEPVATLVRTILLSGDLLRREACLSGERTDVEPVVLTHRQMSGDDPLPHFLLHGTERTAGDRILTDSLWAAYFRYANRVAQELRSGFLKKWVAFEVGLRNALAADRASALGLEADDYQVAGELGAVDQAEAALAEWRITHAPDAAERALDQARWDWLSANDDWFSFSYDEIAAYAVRLMLVSRWHLLTAVERDSEIVAPKPSIS